MLQVLAEAVNRVATGQDEERCDQECDALHSWVFP
jgi:hypothetical protein